jgi:hypothetical protein
MRSSRRFLAVLCLLTVFHPLPGSFTARARPGTSSPIDPPAWFDRITVADGLSFPAVRSVIQDQRGFIWIATDSGLNRYDSWNMTVFRNDEKLERMNVMVADIVAAVYEPAR